MTLDKAFKGTLAWLVAPALVWVSVFLNGDVQTGYYYGFIALLWTAARAQVRTARVFSSWCLSAF